ncbi:MAG: hypothetical protein ACI8ZB_003538 [Desulforhopalus sp.]|jgi:hypothetical protein
MDITITTPALLFPAVTFLLVAYTSRFLAINARIRNLYERYQEKSDEVIIAQIISLKKRVVLIRNMQACGVAGLFLCVFCMLMLFGGWVQLGKIFFTGSLLLLLASLGISLVEIFISVDAISIELRDFEKRMKKAKIVNSKSKK